MRTLVTMGSLTGLALSLAACGSSGTPADDTSTSGGTTATAASASLDPCSLLSAQEMTAITTDPVTDLIREDNSCTYKTRPDDNPRIAVSEHDGHKQMETARRAAGVIEGMGGSVAGKGAAGADVAAMTKRSADAPQVGDDAIWGIAGILYARKGDAYVEVYPPTIHDPAVHSGNPLISTEEKRKITTTIARQVFTRLGA